MAGAWIFFVLLASVACNPEMKYSFCSITSFPCEPKTFASNSPLEFGNITSGVYFEEKYESKQLSVSCEFSEPLHWILTSALVLQEHEFHSISSYVTINDSRLLYFYRFNLKSSLRGLIRCESYENPDMAAEMYIAWRNPTFKYLQGNSKVMKYFPTGPRRGGQLIVPCSMNQFDLSLNVSQIRLKKLKENQMKTPKITQECFNCFPHGEETEENCTSSCSYGISQQLWNDVKRPLGSTKSGSQYLDCVNDAKCAFQTVKKVLEKLVIEDCDRDGTMTCFDRFSAISHYPYGCRQNHPIARFVKIEACIFENLAQVLDSKEADFDPRIGFRLKTERDINAVYVCASETTGAYFSPVNPSEKMEVTLQSPDSYMQSTLKGLFCIVPSQRFETVNMGFVQCSTLFECELQLKTFEAFTIFRWSKKMGKGEPISKVNPRLFGKILENPPTSGVIQCSGFYYEANSHILDLQYFFTGLDSKFHFMSSSMPAETVISLKKVQTNTTVSNGLAVDVECTIVTFIVFPNFEFLIQYSNGTITRTEKTLGPRPNFLLDSHHVSQRLKESFKEGASVESIICRAPLRNSAKKVEAILTIDPPKKAPSSETDSKSQIHTVVIPIVASILLLLGSAICAVYGVRKYNKSKEMRQLTLDEINEFLNGNAALATESSNELNVDGIGFPESFQIPPEDLKINMREVHGEGQFGRCVSGVFHDRQVAVKITKPSADVETFKDFLREVKVMAYLGKHENIVEFLGAVVNELRSRICLAVVELSPYGDLLSYLRKTDLECASIVIQYVNLPSGGQCELSKLGMNILSYFCEQIAAAMEFVVDKKVLHGDLAARNVLVFPDYVVKISDFGLSRKLYKASNYKKKSNTPLPWRWMAIESLKYMEFSRMTDMWAYGVTVWEIFSLGEVPFAGLIYSCGFIDQMEGGLRLQRPKKASEEIFQFMELMWNRIPSARPSFEDAKIFFRRHSLRNQ